jgi:serine/threonine protein phosphatase PrpC
MLTNIFHLNEQGKRKNIEDHIFPAPGKATNENNLFIVCDGVGGLSKGEEASRIACKGISEYILSLHSKNINAKDIDAAVDSAVEQMHEYAAIYPAAEQMSTTLTLAYLQDKSIWVAWCGDSRIYHIRSGKVIWQSKDHSLVQQLIEAGEISKEEALLHPQKNIILRSLSAANRNVNIDTHFIAEIIPGDFLLLCTDGILENIGDNEIMEILGPQQKEVNKTKLFLQYCAGKTSDNFSMYLLELGKGKNTSANKRNILLIVTALVLIVIMSITFLYWKNQNESKNKLIQPVMKDTIQKSNNSIRTNNTILNMLKEKIKADSGNKKIDSNKHKKEIKAAKASALSNTSIH